MEKKYICFLLKVHTCTGKYLYVHTLSNTFWVQKVISPNGWHQLFHQVNEEFASFKKSEIQSIFWSICLTVTWLVLSGVGSLLDRGKAHGTVCAVNEFVFMNWIPKLTLSCVVLSAEEWQLLFSEVCNYKVRLLFTHVFKKLMKRGILFIKLPNLAVLIFEALKF